MRREIAEQKALIEELKEEAENKARSMEQPLQIFKTMIRSSQNIAEKLRGSVVHWTLCRKEGPHSMSRSKSFEIWLPIFLADVVPLLGKFSFVIVILNCYESSL